MPLKAGTLDPAVLGGFTQSMAEAMFLGPIRHLVSRPAAGHAAVDDQDVAIHDFHFRPVHRAPPKFVLVADSSGGGCRQPINTEILGFAEQRG